MNSQKISCGWASDLQFWNGYAKWYKLWLEHNCYHDRISDILTNTVKPGWKILDIGSGNGVLSMPLCAMGCEVTALEPATEIRRLLHEEALKKEVKGINVDDRKWEDVFHCDYHGFDLIMACNSLHLTGFGFEHALQKIFLRNPKRVFIITELNPGIDLTETYGGYSMRLARSYETESSFAYHDIDEVLDHWTFKKGGKLSAQELLDINRQLTISDNHLWIKDTVNVSMFWWERWT